MTSLDKQHKKFALLPGHIKGVQETKFNRDDQLKFRKDLPKGQHVVFGKALQDKSKEAGGVAIVSSIGPLAEPKPLNEQEETLLDSGRYVRAALPLGKGERCLHIISFYGFTNAMRKSEARRSNEELLRLL